MPVRAWGFESPLPHHFLQATSREPQAAGRETRVTGRSLKLRSRNRQLPFTLKPALRPGGQVLDCRFRLGDGAGGMVRCIREEVIAYEQSRRVSLTP